MKASSIVPYAVAALAITGTQGIGRQGELPPPGASMSGSPPPVASSAPEEMNSDLGALSAERQFLLDLFAANRASIELGTAEIVRAVRDLDGNQIQGLGKLRSAVVDKEQAEYKAALDRLRAYGRVD